MKFLAAVPVLLGVVATALGQTIELGAPKAGAVLVPGQNFTAQVIRPPSMADTIEVGIALAMDNCENGICPQPDKGVGNVLYAGPWNATLHVTGVYYQNFTLQVPEYMSSGPAIFTLTHFCLIGAGPAPLLEFRNVSVNIK